MSSVSSAEKIEVMIDPKVTIKKSQPDEKPNGTKNNYNRIAGTLNIRHLQSSLSEKCEDLVKFQKKIVEQLEVLMGKISKKAMEE